MDFKSLRQTLLYGFHKLYFFFKNTYTYYVWIEVLGQTYKSCYNRKWQKISHNLFYPLGYCSRLWISSCSGPNVVRNFWRCSKTIFAKRKRVLFWAGITFKISEAWNLQVKVMKYLVIYFWPSINDVTQLEGRGI